MPANNEQPRWSITAWVWVILCAAAISATIPFARQVQKFVYAALGKGFFTYAVLASVITGAAFLLYQLVFKLKVKSRSQYLWIFACFGSYVFFTFQLRTYPEEAVHLIEFGLLSFLVYKAFSVRIRDWTVYLSSILFVAIFGVFDEFIQWLTPGRFWDYKDAGVNAVAGVIFVAGIWKGIKPDRINRPVSEYSINMLTAMAAILTVVLALCLSNTPDVVKNYSLKSKSLKWLYTEEPMTEFGHKYYDPEIGTLYSRFSLQELKELDLENSLSVDKIFAGKIPSKDELKELIKVHSPNENPFMHEFMIHVFDRNDNFLEYEHDNNESYGRSALKGNMLLEKYFGNTLSNSNQAWSSDKVNSLKKQVGTDSVDHMFRVGRIITFFNLTAARAVLTVLLICIWVLRVRWKKSLLTDG